MSEKKRKRMENHDESRFKPLQELRSRNQPTVPFNPILQQPIIINPALIHGEHFGKAVQILQLNFATNQNLQPNLMYFGLPPGVNQLQSVIEEILTTLLGTQANVTFVTEVQTVNPEEEQELTSFLSNPEVSLLRPVGISADAMKWKKQFKCAFPGCIVKFSSLYEQKIHADTHMPAANTKFKCSICGMLFDRATDRNKHVDSHTIAYTYKCKMCKKSFPYYISLMKHKNVEKCAVSRSFSCNFCNVQFLDADDLEKHQKVNMKLCPCRSKICGKQAFKLHTSLCIVYKQRMGKNKEGSRKKKPVSMLLS